MTGVSSVEMTGVLSKEIKNEHYTVSTAYRGLAVRFLAAYRIYLSISCSRIGGDLYLVRPSFRLDAESSHNRK